MSVLRAKGPQAEGWTVLSFFQGFFPGVDTKPGTLCPGIPLSRPFPHLKERQGLISP